MTTVLDTELRRQITIDGADYTVALDRDGLRLTGKGKRRPEVELRWRDLLSGDAALAFALNASLQPRPAAGGARKPATEAESEPATEAAPKAPVKAARKPTGKAALQPSAKLTPEPSTEAEGGRKSKKPRP